MLYLDAQSFTRLGIFFSAFGAFYDGVVLTIIRCT